MKSETIAKKFLKIVKKQNHEPEKNMGKKVSKLDHVLKHS